MALLLAAGAAATPRSRSDHDSEDADDPSHSEDVNLTRCDLDLGPAEDDGGRARFWLPESLPAGDDVDRIRFVAEALGLLGRRRLSFPELRIVAAGLGDFEDGDRTRFLAEAFGLLGRRRCASEHPTVAAGLGVCDCFL